MKTIGRMMLVGLSPLLMHGDVIFSNMLTNPGAETGNLMGWIIGGTSNPTVDDGTFDPGISPNTGSFDFRGGTGPSGSLSQTFTIITGVVTPSLVDSGTLSADVSFWEQGLNQGTPSDNAFIQVTFVDGSSSVISTISTPDLDSHSGSWANFTSEYAIPVGTRSVTYSMEFVRAVGSDLDAFVDDNILGISGTPEPSTFSAVLLGIGALGLFRHHRRGREQTTPGIDTLASIAGKPRQP